MGSRKGCPNRHRLEFCKRGHARTPENLCPDGHHCLLCSRAHGRDWWRNNATPERRARVNKRVRKRKRIERKLHPDKNKRSIKEYRKSHPGFSSYCLAKKRCTNRKAIHWPYYGGRGIRFLFTSYKQLIAEIGLPPSKEHTIDLFPNNDGNYESGNVRWATRKEQANNRRKRRAA